MKNSVKGGLAAATAAVLLLGGGGTLAYWNETETTTGPRAITSGHLDLTPGTCQWDLQGLVGSLLTDVDPTAVLLAPGDVLTRTCALTLSVAGDTMVVDFTVDTEVAPAGDLAAALTAATSFTVGGDPYTGGTGLPEGSYAVQTVTTLTMGSDLAESLEDTSGTLGDLVVTAGQKTA
ncbi:alternate-type signal peptide domain-containing protein [Nocardioides bruguierae]|uniref:alternate-type signal peptide domain-containing protein n=1 Tax=Nocardioides bruguierae TaxID=2945102 RepID=UPI0020217484|nr:alternate-type signal peptide domain-containing protein [Nocardioides bruguierae]MCL8027369.1 alternate-type signal peptide domain-containing protein [Nocardioides bruguierae]